MKNDLFFNCTKIKWIKKNTWSLGFYFNERIISHLVIAKGSDKYKATKGFWFTHIECSILGRTAKCTTKESAFMAAKVMLKCYLSLMKRRGFYLYDRHEHIMNQIKIENGKQRKERVFER